MSWFIVLKAFCKLMRTIPVSRPESKPVNILFGKYESEVFVEWLLGKPDQYLQRMLLSVKYSIIWSCITFSKILGTIGSREIGLKLLESVLVPFLYKVLRLATLQSFGK